MKFDQSGVLAANKIFHESNHTTKTRASGQLVMNQVIFQTHFTFFKADKISSILNPTKNIKTIIHDAHKKDSLIFHHIIIEDHIKKSNVIHQIIKSNFCKESKNKFFITFNC